MHRCYVDTPGGQVHARRAGHGPVTLVLLHQTASSSRMYERFAGEFFAHRSLEDYTLLALDTPGFGQSYRPEGLYSIDRWSEDVAAALDALGVGAFHVLGHHTGAAIAIRVAARFPGRVRSLTMIGPVVMSDDERASWHAGVRAMSLQPDGSHVLDVWRAVAAIDGTPSAFPPDLALQHREAVDKLAAGTRWHEAYLAVFSTDLAGELATVACPTLLVVGWADVLFPYLEATRAQLPTMRCVQIDAGAYVLDQDPWLVVHPLLELLDGARDIGVPA